MSIYSLPDYYKYCKWCGNDKKWHATEWSRCRYGFAPTEPPQCRVCGKNFNPAKSGREDCCYRHRFDS